MKYILHLFIFLATPLLSLGQNSLINSSASSGIGNCYTTQEGVWSVSTNPAGVANHNQYSIGIGLKNNFGMKPRSWLMAIMRRGEILSGAVAPNDSRTGSPSVIPAARRKVLRLVFIVSLILFFQK